MSFSVGADEEDFDSEISIFPSLLSTEAAFFFFFFPFATGGEVCGSDGIGCGGRETSISITCCGDCACGSGGFGGGASERTGLAALLSDFGLSGVMGVSIRIVCFGLRHDLRGGGPMSLWWGN
jgi:hypothetical protein